MIDDEDEYPEKGVLKLFHKTPECVVMIGRESEDGIYEPKLTLNILGKAMVTKHVGIDTFNLRLRHVGKRTIQNSLPHVSGIRISEKSLDSESDTKCKICKLSK